MIILSIFLVLAALTTQISGDEVKMGTTIFCVKFRDGVVVGADSRTSVSGYVSNRFATKISFVLENQESPQSMSSLQASSSLLGKEHIDNLEKNQVAIPSTTCCICRSGSAADTQNLADAVRFQLLKRQILNRASSSILNVATLIKNILLNNELQASLICAGYDQDKGGIIYSIDLGGTMMKQDDFACNGSGSGYILGHIDNVIKRKRHLGQEFSYKDMTEEEAVAFVVESIGLAIQRDGSSGGVVRIFVITKDGKKELLKIPSKPESPMQKTEPSNLSKFAMPERRMSSST